MGASEGKDRMQSIRLFPERSAHMPHMGASDQVMPNLCICQGEIY